LRRARAGRKGVSGEKRGSAGEVSRFSEKKYLRESRSKRLELSKGAVSSSSFAGHFRGLAKSLIQTQKRGLGEMRSERNYPGRSQKKHAECFVVWRKSKRKRGRLERRAAEEEVFRRSFEHTSTLSKDEKQGKILGKGSD